MNRQLNTELLSQLPDYRRKSTIIRRVVSGVSCVSWVVELIDAVLLIKTDSLKCGLMGFRRNTFIFVIPYRFLDPRDLKPTNSLNVNQAESLDFVVVRRDNLRAILQRDVFRDFKCERG